MYSYSISCKCLLAYVLIHSICADYHRGWSNGWRREKVEAYEKDENRTILPSTSFIMKIFCSQSTIDSLTQSSYSRARNTKRRESQIPPWRIIEYQVNVIEPRCGSHCKMDQRDFQEFHWESSFQNARNIHRGLLQNKLAVWKRGIKR